VNGLGDFRLWKFHAYEESCASAVEKSHDWSRKAVLLEKYRQGNALEAAGSACEAWPLAERKTSQLANTWQSDTKSEVRDR
jgi:hypothetical protein